MAANRNKPLADEISLHAYIESTKAILDAQLKTLNPTIQALKLHKQIEYALQTKGKHLRAAMVLLSGESVGGNPQRLEKLALAVELLHAASLVHDDILDREVFRRNALSVQAKWSVKEAVLVGDALASLALGLCRGYGDEVLDIMSAACLQLSDGEYMDVSAANAPPSEQEYFEKTRKKTGALFRAAAECGVMAANGTPAEAKALAAFGENYGAAFQINDDLQDVALMENTSASDISELRATLPVVRFLTEAGESAENLLTQLNKAKAGTPRKKMLAAKFQAELKKLGCLAYCTAIRDKYAEEASISLSILRKSRAKACLTEMAEQLKR